MLPWVSIETSPIGGARPCCLYREEIKNLETNSRLNLTETTLTEAYKSPYMQKLRQDFRAGIKPTNCSPCWDEEAAGRQSKRMSTFIRLPNLAKTVDWNNDSPDQLKFIDLKLGNICNLKCRICGSWSSSKWAEEELNYMPETDKRDHQAYTFLKQGQWPRKSSNFWSNLKSLLPEIIYFEFTGGEPFLINEHFELLKFAVDTGHANHIEIHYNTNATVLPEAAVDIWKHFKTVEIAFSIDNVGDRFEYERYGARWEEATRIVQKINSLRTHLPCLKTQVCLTASIFNIYYMEDLCNWVNQQNFNYNHFNLLHGDKEFRIDMMTPLATEKVVERLRNGNFQPVHRMEIDRLINFIQNGPGSDGRAFIRRVKQTDQYRKQSLIETHEEIALLMGYND